VKHIDSKGNETIILNEDCIKSYNWKSHCIEIKENCFEEISKIEIQTNDTFEIFLYDSCLLKGYFINNQISTLNPHVPVSYHDMENRIPKDEKSGKYYFIILDYMSIIDTNKHTLNNNSLKSFLEDNNLLTNP